MSSLNLSVPLADSKIIKTMVVPPISAAVSTSQCSSRVDTMTCAQAKLTQLLESLPPMTSWQKVGTMKSPPTNAVQRSASWCATTGIPHLNCALLTKPNLACPAPRIEKSVSPIKSAWLTLFTSIHTLPLSIPDSIATEEAYGFSQITLSLAPGLNTMTIQIFSFRTEESCLLRWPTAWSLISSQKVTLSQILMHLGSTRTGALIPISFQKHSEDSIT